MAEGQWPCPDVPDERALRREASACGVVAVARALGLAADGTGRFGPCPVCRVRRSADGSAPAEASLVLSPARWSCRRCAAIGDALALACWHLEGAPFASLDGVARALVARWFEHRSRCSTVRPSDP